MSFQVDSIAAAHVTHRLASKREYRGNRITLLVGPNGSGKTQLLVDMLEYYLPRRSVVPSQSPVFRIEGKGKPSRVIAQTFSPFSKFPQEQRKPPTLSEYLQSNVGTYAAIGVTRTNSFGRQVSRVAVSRILRRLYAHPSDSAYFAETLENIGFMPKLVMAYTRSPLGRSVEFNASSAEVQRALEEYLSTIKGRQRPWAQELPLFRELSEKETGEGLVALLGHAISTITGLKRSESSEVRKADFAIEIDLGKGIDIELKSHLHAFLVLTRAGFLHIRNCFVTYALTEGRSQFRSARSETLDITDASSGQQQLLSSLFGIAAETEDGALLLIDEPELSLHPEWQSNYLDNLLATLRSRRDCEVFVATHSPLIIQRARELNVEMLDLGSNRLDHSSAGTVSVDQVLLENFNVPVRDSTYVGQLLLSLVVQAERGQAPIASLTDRLKKLQDLYEQSVVQDAKMNKLIEQATKLVLSANRSRT